MQVDLGTQAHAAAVPAHSFPTAELNRATDLLLDAAGGGSNIVRTAAWAAVEEVADWCAIDLLDGEALKRAVCVEGASFDPEALSGAVARFGPDPMLVRRLEIAGRPVRVEDPDWLPGHRAIAAGIAGGAEPLGYVLALVPLGDEELADQLWFMGELGHRLGQVLGLSPAGELVGGEVVAEPGWEPRRSRGGRLRRAI